MPLDKSVMFHQPPAGPKHTSAHWRSCGGVIEWDAIAEWSSKEQKGSWRRHHKQALEVVAWGCFSVLGGDVSGGDRSAMRERSEAKKLCLERELPCYPVRLKCIRLIGFQIDMQDMFRVGRPTRKLYILLPQRNISVNILAGKFINTMLLATKLNCTRCIPSLARRGAVIGANCLLLHLVFHLVWRESSILNNSISYFLIDTFELCRPLWVLRFVTKGLQYIAQAFTRVTDNNQNNNNNNLFFSASCQNNISHFRLV